LTALGGVVVLGEGERAVAGNILNKETKVSLIDQNTLIHL